MQTVKPELVSGVRDLLPAEAIAQARIVEVVKEVYESFGFVPLETPCLERWGVLTGNAPNFNKSIFTTKVVRGAEDAEVDIAEISESDSALRFDLTVPLSRVVAAYPDLPKPFKRYQIGRVFRGEKAASGRFREFTQLDFDIIGSRNILADVETIQIMYEAMKALDLGNFTIRFNTRKLLNALSQIVGRVEKANELFRILDKVGGKGVDWVLKELQRKPDNDFDENALALSRESVQIIENFLALSNFESGEILEKAAGIFGGNRLGEEALSELQVISSKLKLLGIPRGYWCIDLSVARGLDYYVGPVFEAYMDVPGLGSVFSGGRFDGLSNRFMPGSNIPGVGASVGIDRVIIGLEKLGKLTKSPSVTQVLVTVFGAEWEEQSLLFSQELRRAGFNVDIYMGEDRTLKAQVVFARTMEIPFVVIIGPDEAANGVVQLKNMGARKQERLTKEACIHRIRESL